ncbi:MAG: hypothetical protein NVS2B4_14670 [Ramlibacter sp.]
MSLLNLFTRKKPSDDHAPPSSGLADQEPSIPAPRRAGDAAPVSSRRSERSARRELLYMVVRDCMNRAGVLSASYKFKVLSLDARGRQFLVMVDVPGVLLRSADRLAEIEAMIAQAAKAGHNIAIKAVYWRQNDHVSVGLSKGAEAGKVAEPQTHAAPAVDPVPPQGSGYEPIAADEVAAFRTALVTGAKTPREPRSASPRNYTLLTGFEHTEIRDDRPAAALSGSQHGDLL